MPQGSVEGVSLGARSPPPPREVLGAEALTLGAEALTLGAKWHSKAEGRQ